jgi:hypothetical protein
VLVTADFLAQVDAMMAVSSLLAVTLKSRVHSTGTVVVIQCRILC